MKGFYSPIDKLAEQMARPKGTGAEFMTELSKKPGFKQAEVEDRNLQALQSLPKMAREDFIANLKAQRPTMPKERVFRNDPKNLTYEEDYDKQYHGVTGEPYHEEHTLPGGTNYREILLQHPHGSFPGVSGHFGGAPNILASMRVKDRISPEGKKILHIEEIQSDWHKKGSKKGYAPIGEDLHDTAKQAEMAHRRLKEKLAQAKSNSQNAEGVLASDRPLYQDPEVRARYTEALKGHNRDIMDLMPQVMKAEEAHRVARDRANNAVPDAPFKKNWHELALKRMIQHAVENGYDEIHITPGEMQAERWGASGEGAKGFHDLYDKQMPQFLNKFGKQFGAQVGRATIPGNPDDTDAVALRMGYTPRQWHDWTPAERETELKKIDAANVTPLHSFRITPEMREHVLKHGMPLYNEGGSVDRDEGLQKFLEPSAEKRRMYHATHGDFNAFRNNRRGVHFVTPDPEFANDFLTNSGQDKHQEGANVMPVHVQAKNPFDYENKKHVNALAVKASIGKAGIDQIKKGNWNRIEDRTTLQAIKNLGHDSVYVNEGGVKNLGVFHPHQIKSAIGNRGTYDINEPDITKAKGGTVSRETIKPMPHGIIKERVTVAPNRDAMEYELLSAKHFTKKVK